MRAAWAPTSAISGCAMQPMTSSAIRTRWCWRLPSDWASKARPSLRVRSGALMEWRRRNIALWPVSEIRLARFRLDAASLIDGRLQHLRADLQYIAPADDSHRPRPAVDNRN